MLYLLLETGNPATALTLLEGYTLGSSGGTAFVAVDPATGAQNAVPNTTYPSPSTIYYAGLAVDSRGTMLTAQYDTSSPKTPISRLVRISPVTGSQAVITSGGALLASVRTIALSRAGQVAVQQYTRYSGGAAFVFIDPTTGAQRVVPNMTLPINGPYYVGLGFDPAGAMFSIRVDLSSQPATAQLFRIDPDTGSQTLISSGGALTNAIDLAVSPNGEILVQCGTGAPNSQVPAFAYVDPATGAQTIVPNIMAGYDLTTYQGLTLDSDGYIFTVAVSRLTGTWTQTLVRIDPDTGSQTHVSSGGILTGEPFLALCPVFGVDVSHHQYDQGGTIDWDAVAWDEVAAAGKSFAFVKASQGERVPDPTSTNSIQKACSAGLLCAPYHLCGTGNGTVSSPIILGDPLKEARNFLNRASGWIGNGYLPPILDIEADFDSGDPKYDNPTDMSLSEWATAWVQFVQQQTGVTPIIYTHHSVLETPVLNPLLAFLPQDDLWVLNWDNSPTASPWHGGWKFKQYASDGSTPTGHCDGIPDPADLDSFNGSLPTLQALTNYPAIVKFSGIGWTPLQPPNSGTFSLQIFAPALSSVTVQVTEDLTSWRDLAVVPIMSNRVGYFIDLSANTSTLLRLYRIKY